MYNFTDINFRANQIGLFYYKSVSSLRVFSKTFLHFIHLFIYFCLFAISWAAPAAYGGSQARGLIGAVAAGLSNSGSEPHL